MSPDPEIVQGAPWLNRIARFRVEVWTEAQMIDPACFPDGRCLEEADQTATHVVVEEKGQLLGAIRYTQYPDIDSTHHGAYYRQSGVDLEGPIGVPERLVVRPEATRSGVAWALAAEISRLAVTRAARHVITECSPRAAALMRKRGRRSLGIAPPDPRFPKVRFEWMLSDVEVIAAELRAAAASTPE